MVGNLLQNEYLFLGYLNYTLLELLREEAIISHIHKGINKCGICKGEIAMP